MPAPTLSALSGFNQRVVVGVGDLAVSNHPNAVLTTYSLGSCLGVAIYDPVVRVGGLLHAMLPDSSIDEAKAVRQPAMFMDTGLPLLFRSAYALRAEKHRMQISVAGGAQLLDEAQFFKIGKRNYDCLKRILAQHGLRIQAEQVGGLFGRTMFLNIATGEVELKITGQADPISLFGG